MTNWDNLCMGSSQSGIHLSEDLLHVNIRIILLSEKKRVWGIFKPNHSFKYPRPFSSFYLMNIIMMLQMSAMFLRRETFETFLTYCIIMVIASTTKQYPLGHAKVSFENFDTLTAFSGIV